MMLSGIRVIEMGQNVAGPHAAQILGDLGAEVIKIERPGGEEGRKLGPPFAGDDAAWFHQINRGKKSVIVDLRNDADRMRLVELIGTADVFLHNTRPGVLTTFGLDAITLRALFPRLIYADISAFGNAGPLADRPGYELLMQAFGGLMSITGGPDAPPTRMGPSMVDLGTGMWVAIGVLSALFHRTSTGAGTHLQASLLETALGFSAIHIVNFVAAGTMPERSTDGFAGLAPYGGMSCADGVLIVGAGNDRLFAKLATALGHAEWALEPRFASNAARVSNRDLLAAELAPMFEQATVDQMATLLDEAGVPNAPVRTIPELLTDPQVKALGMLSLPKTTDAPALLGLPMSFDGVRPTPRRPTPQPGENQLTLFGRHDS